MRGLSPETIHVLTLLGVAIVAVSPILFYGFPSNLDLSNHFRWMLTGKPGGQSYYQSIFSESVSLAYAEALIRANCADTLWAVGRSD